MADQGIEEMNQMVAEFSGITGSDEERARFYLQSANWDLNIALETFYDQSAEADQPDMEDVIEREEPESMQPVQNITTAPAARSKPNSNIFSLSSYKEEKSDDTEEGQAYYAGGSKHSGQQILGPDKNKKSKNPTGDLFEAAKKHGASSAHSDEEMTTSKSNKSYFQGAGYKLGSDVEPSQQVSASLSKDNLSSNKPQTAVVKFWSNGFSIDAGPLRDFNDPANKNFLDSIAKGEVPAELRSLVRNAEVHVNMEDHREEEYVKPKETLKAFSGKGQMLGSPSPNIVERSSSPLEASSDNSQTTPSFQVNESSPVTTIQIRLADGTRLVSKFNHNSTIGDIRDVVRRARPNTGNFNLMTTFPKKVLSEDEITLTDAKLLNAVIVQRMT